MYPHNRKFFTFSWKTKERKGTRGLLYRILLNPYSLISKDCFSGCDMYPGYIRYRLFILKKTNQAAERIMYIYIQLTESVRTDFAKCPLYNLISRKATNLIQSLLISIMSIDCQIEL